MKKINITGKNLNQKFLWAKKVNADNFILIKHDGYQFALVARNYYIDRKADKIRYNGTGSAYCKNASYNKLFALYVQPAPGLEFFAYAGNVSDEPNAIDNKIRLRADQLKSMDLETIQGFFENVKQY